MIPKSFVYAFAVAVVCASFDAPGWATFGFAAVALLAVTGWDT